MSDHSEPRHEFIFYEALELPEGERNRFLDEACGGNQELRAEVDELLQAHEGAAGFLPREGLAAPELQAEVGRIDPERAGDHLGPYKLLEQIGEGGFGTVWVAEQEIPVRRRVALKIIKPGMDTKEVIARFEQERQALAMMDHPNIARVLDAGATPLGRPYFVMELVRGTRITEFCDQANLPTAERLRIFIAVCHAVQHAHQKGIIHRDLKPSNILVTLHDGVPVPKVIDFGIAKATQQQRLTDLTIYTQFEQLIGTPLYMSPEQVERSGLDIDTRSDIYSLGVLLYELLVGRPPFDPETLMKRGLDEIRRVVREQEPQKPSTFVSTMAMDLRANLAQHRQTDGTKLIGQIRGDLDWIVMKALEKDRARRYDTATGLAEDIQRHLGSEPVQARPPTSLYRFRRFVKRNKVAFTAGAALLAVIIVGLGVSTWMFLKEKQALERTVAAEKEQERLRQFAAAEGKTAESESARRTQTAEFIRDMIQAIGPSIKVGHGGSLLRTFLDKTAEQIGPTRQSGDFPALIASIYYGLGDLQKSEALLREDLAMRRKALGDQHSEVVTAIHNLALVLIEQDKQTEAEVIALEGLTTAKNLHGDEHGQVARALDNLAGLLCAKGKRAEGEAMFREALAMQRKLLGDQHPSMAMSLFRLGTALCKHGKLAESEAMLREALKIQRKVLGNEHPDAWSSLNNLAYALDEQSKWAESELLQREALEIGKKIFGEEHGRIANMLNNLGENLRFQGKLAEAEAVQREALAMNRKLHGDESGEASNSLYNLALAISAPGRMGEAETLHREALAIRKKLWGDEHLMVARSLRELATVIGHQHRFAEAETIYREALAIRRKSQDADPTSVAFTLNELGAALSRQGKLAEAVAVAREALMIRQKALGDGHPDVAASLEQLAEVLTLEGSFPEAEKVFREWLPMARKLSPDDFRRLENGATNFAETLYRLSKFPESESLLREVIRNQQSRDGMEAGKLKVMSRLARLLADWAWSERGQDSKNLKPEVLKRAREAETLLRECQAILLRGEVPDPGTFTGDEFRSRLGRALLSIAVTDPTLTITTRNAKLAEAEALLVNSNEALQQSKEAPREFKRDSLIRLVHLYQAWEKPDQAAAWQQSLSDFDKAVAAPDGEPKAKSSKH